MLPIIGHTLGFPRIGLYRELKYALEQYWNDIIDQDKLLNIGKMLRLRHWKQQIDAGIDMIPVGDFAWYDHVLTTSAMLDNIPLRHRLSHSEITLDTLFRVARGYSDDDGNMVIPSEMKKWFNTNYHYIVPEFVKNQKFNLNWTQLFDEIDESLSLNHAIKPVLLGPISYLWLGKIRGDNFNKLSLLPSLIEVYQKILCLFSEKNIEWVQIDEPILVLELPKSWLLSYIDVYQKLCNSKLKLLLTTYFDGIYHHLDLIKQMSVDGLHVDLVSSSDHLSLLHQQLPQHWILSAGVINGRNIWKTDVYSWFCKLYPIVKERSLWIGSSCSLLHIPIDINAEIKLNQTIKSWFAFALQKCSEIHMLCDSLNKVSNENYINQKNVLKEYSFKYDSSRMHSNLVLDAKVRERCNDKSELIYARHSEFIQRSKLQHEKLNLPVYPMTTIGSFPQTQKIRNLRMDLKNNRIDYDFYDMKIKKYIKEIIREQERLGLDVLVHGEPERNDMVEYFGERLNGFAFTQYGWVQSYGSRCVKPPIIIGDISRSQPISIPWISYAQSLTDKPVKGILTGPITMLSWSFIREDVERHMVALQLALAIRDEVMDLEKSGIRIIQIDEPAFREGLPLKISDQKNYLNWSINAFKLTVSAVKDDTQIHTHMCYSEFDSIMCDLLKLDADVITIEASRSDFTLLESIKRSIDDVNEIGLGVYDIHAVHIPKKKNLIDKINQFLKYIPEDKLWINPDCGLKTRSWFEINQALGNMVSAVRELRK